MKKMKMLTAMVLAVLLLALATGCGAKSLLAGSWTNADQTMEMQFDKEGNVTITAYGIPLPATYQYDGDVLTIYYSETISQEGTLTFFGDNEFCWENTDSDGQTYQDYYTRMN